MKNTSNAAFSGNCELDDFEPCEADEAMAMMKGGLHKSMAYSAVMIGEDAADAWARSFVESFSHTTQWYSNMDEGAPLTVTSATFDLCIVAVDTASSAIGYLLITDED